MSLIEGYPPFPLHQNYGLVDSNNTNSERTKRAEYARRKTLEKTRTTRCQVEQKPRTKSQVEITTTYRTKNNQEVKRTARVSNGSNIEIGPRGSIKLR